MLISFLKFTNINLIAKDVIFKSEGLILYIGIDLKKFKRTNSNSKTFIQLGAFNDKKGQKITSKSLDSDLFKKLLVSPQNPGKKWSLKRIIIKSKEKIKCVV